MAAAGLQRYQVIGELGTGSQGQTFRAIDRATGREVAVKVLRLATMDGWKSFDLFERECQVLAELDHPGIPRFLDRFASEGTGEFFLVRELIAGEPLSARIAARRTMDEPALRGLLDQALDILAYLHDRRPPIIHRDLKPSNFILGDDGRLRLIDFGAVRVAITPEGGSTMIGTYGYMAPEQLHGEVTPAVDIYGLGATLAALAAGLDADKLPRAGLRIDLTRVLPASPLREVLAGMLAPDPAERLASVDAVRRALGGAARPGPRPAPTASPAPDPASALAPRPEAPADLDEPLRSLARIPPPFSIILWVFVSLMVGVLVVLEVALVPFFFKLAASGDKTDDERRRIATQRQGALRSLADSRRTLQALAERTHPLQGERRALPPGDRDDRR